jgi:RNA recognition motif-containing protein
MRDENQKSRGFGFVAFKESSQAQLALSENSQQEGGLYVREALSKEQR